MNYGLDSGGAKGISLSCAELLEAGVGATTVESTRVGYGTPTEHSRCPTQTVMVGLKYGPDTQLMSFAPVCAALAEWTERSVAAPTTLGPQIGSRSLDSEVACPQGYVLTSVEGAWTGVGSGLAATLRGVCTVVNTAL
ncbi:MAG: hypothetical protein JNK82_42665 [Myxococcaceae bacterium]|nr:hypothetical protein [Myxococcaceae bacterium]